MRDRVAGAFNILVGAFVVLAVATYGDPGISGTSAEAAANEPCARLNCHEPLGPSLPPEVLQDHAMLVAPAPADLAPPAEVEKKDDAGRGGHDKAERLRKIAETHREAWKRDAEADDDDKENDDDDGRDGRRGHRDRGDDDERDRDEDDD